MNNEELVAFLKTTLIKVENAINLLDQDVPKHIPAYHKALGIQQKLSLLPGIRRDQMFSQIIIARSIINYLMNGRYEDALAQILKLRKEFVQICMQLQNEKNTNKQVSEKTG